MYRRLNALVALPWLLATLGATLPGEAVAGAVLVPTDRFAVSSGSGPITQTPAELYGAGSYYGVVRLPAGARIKKLRVTFKCIGPSSSFQYTVRLIRKKPGSSGETVVDSGFLGFTGYVAPTNYATADADLVGPSMVERGYRYFVQLHLNDSGGRIHDVRVV